MTRDRKIARGNRSFDVRCRREPNREISRRALAPGSPSAVSRSVAGLGAILFSTLQNLGPEMIPWVMEIIEFWWNANEQNREQIPDELLDSIA